MTFKQAFLLSAAATLALCPVAGRAQKSDDITTVAPVEVGPVAGRGASALTPAEISETLVNARALANDAGEAARACNTLLSSGGPLPEDMGAFGIGALSASESRAGLDLERAAQAALSATEAAQGTHSAEAELVRQGAIRAFLDRKRVAEEARRRTLDLIELADERTNGDMFALRALEKGDFVPGCLYDQNGDLRADINQLQVCHLKGETMRQFQGDLDYRTAQRSSGQGGLYTPAEFQDLRLRDVVARQGEAAGAPVLYVTGRIVNTRGREITAPALWIEVADQFGTPLKSEQILARGGAKIRAGGTFRFSYALSPLPDKAVRTQVTFAPSHRPTPYLVAASACPIDPKKELRTETE